MADTLDIAGHPPAHTSSRSVRQAKLQSISTSPSSLLENFERAEPGPVQGNDSWGFQLQVNLKPTTWKDQELGVPLPCLLTSVRPYRQETVMASSAAASAPLLLTMPGCICDNFAANRRDKPARCAYASGVLLSVSSSNLAATLSVHRTPMYAVRACGAAGLRGFTTKPGVPHCCYGV